MKKVVLFALVLAVSLGFAGNAGAEGWYSGLEFGGETQFEFAVGGMNEHELGDFAVNVDAAWPLPLGFSEDAVFNAVGFSTQAGVFFPLGKKDYIDSWWGMDFSLGAYVDLRINELITIRPELAADLRLNMVKSESRSADGTYTDLGARLGATVLFDVFKNGLILKTGADYAIFPEKENVCHYIGINLGAAYRFN